MGRFCWYIFWANPKHKCRVVIAYNVYKGKPKGLRTQFKQISRYCQDKNIKKSPDNLLRKDFVKQCGE